MARIICILLSIQIYILQKKKIKIFFNQFFNWANISVADESKNVRMKTLNNCYFIYIPNAVRASILVGSLGHSSVAVVVLQGN